MFLNAADSLESGFPGKVPKQSLVRPEQQSFGHLEIHENRSAIAGLSLIHTAFIAGNLSIEALDKGVIVV